MGQAQHRLEILIKNIDSPSGSILITLYDNADDFDKNQVQKSYYKKVIVRSQELKLTFDKLPKGVYALKAFHDSNNNGVLDKNWMGIPKEAFGFSNNVMGVMGPPTFLQSAFEVAGKTEHILILR